MTSAYRWFVFTLDLDDLCARDPPLCSHCAAMAGTTICCCIHTCPNRNCNSTVAGVNLWQRHKTAREHQTTKSKHPECHPGCPGWHTLSSGETVDMRPAEDADYRGLTAEKIEFLESKRWNVTVAKVRAWDSKSGKRLRMQTDQIC